jgi:glycogen synthase
MIVDLSAWTRNWALADVLFSAGEIARLRTRLVGLRPSHIVVCSFESRFAKSGGLAPVVMNAIPGLQATGRYDSVSLLSPFYPKLMDPAGFSPAGHFDVLLGRRTIRTTLLQLDVAGRSPSAAGHSEFFVKADGFFESGAVLKDPYLYVEDDSSRNDRALLESALFFCAAVPGALRSMNRTRDVVLHLQEWQTTLASLTAKHAMLDEQLESCGTIQTMHNPYDAFVSKANLKALVTARSRHGRIDALPGTGLTAFQAGLQLVDAPVATVSEHFASELTGDPLQTQHFAPHLQPIFQRSPVVGINNGPFVPFSSKFPKRHAHTLDEIAAIKSEMRRALLTVLDSYAPSERFGALTWRGGSILGLPDDVPIVVMSGRLDPFQKGYDVLLRALRSFAADEIKAVLTPLPMRASDLDFFRETADACHGNVTVFPMRMEKGYLELQTGATFGVMPSLYEPFGAAIEYVVNGTPPIVRRTGGLADQVDHGVNGLCYRERQDNYDLPHIQEYIARSDRVQLRAGNPWATDMGDALRRTLLEGATLFRSRRADYHSMIVRGFEKARTFSWDKNSAEYSALFDTIAAG